MVFHFYVGLSVERLTNNNFKCKKKVNQKNRQVFLLSSFLLLQFHFFVVVPENIEIGIRHHWSALLTYCKMMAILHYPVVVYLHLV